MQDKLCKIHMHCFPNMNYAYLGDGNKRNMLISKNLWFYIQKCMYPKLQIMPTYKILLTAVMLSTVIVSLCSLHIHITLTYM